MPGGRWLDIERDKASWLPGIDGLRAIAILAVLAHHANVDQIHNFALGSMGVALFYAISGFLAYYVLSRDEQRLGRISYTYFMKRRVLRIWPAYFAIIAIVVIYWKARGQFQTGYSNWSLFTFTLNFELQNFHEWPTPGLAQLWSIAVEEQFYLLAPLMYSVLRSRFRWLFCATVFVLANVVRLAEVTAYLGPPGNGGIYYATYAYFDTFLAGALVAQAFVTGRFELVSDRIKWRLFAISLALFVLILFLWGASIWPPYTAWTPVPYFLIPLATGSLLISVVAADSPVAKMFSSTPLRVIATLSYSLYLTHAFVLLVIGPRGEGIFKGLWFNFRFIIVVLLMSVIFYVFIEKPFLKLKASLRPRHNGRVAPAFSE